MPFSSHVSRHTVPDLTLVAEEECPAGYTLRGAQEAFAQWPRVERPAAWWTIAKTKDVAKLVSSVTQHWFRHLLVSTMMTRGDVKAVME